MIAHCQQVLGNKNILMKYLVLALAVVLYTYFLHKRVSSTFNVACSPLANLFKKRRESVLWADRVPAVVQDLFDSGAQRDFKPLKQILLLPRKSVQNAETMLERIVFGAPEILV